VPGTALGCLTSARPIFLGWTLQPRQCAIATKEKVPSVDGKVQSVDGKNDAPLEKDAFVNW